jgi:fructose-bisphosphate aldolase, class I
MSPRASLDTLNLSTGKKARLHRLAEKFYWDYAGEVPLVLKLNGKTEIPSDAAALSPLHATVADAVRLGADAVGYTLYVGTPAQRDDFE